MLVRRYEYNADIGSQADIGEMYVCYLGAHEELLAC